jgi:replicative DNA helicase
MPMATLTESMLPHSIEAEQAVLGAILADADCIMKVIEQLDKPAAFYRKSHQHIFEAFIKLSERGENIDTVTTAQYLTDHKILEEVGGRSYLSELSDHAPIAANAEYYSKIVRDKSILRHMIVAGNEIVQLGYQSGENLERLVDKAEQLVFDLAQSKSKESLMPISDLIHKSWELLEEREANKGALSGVDTGFYDLNTMTAGLQKSDMIILAARPSMGKTALALNLAENVAMKDKRPVAIFSLEMSRDQLVQRMLCSRAEVDSQRVRSGQLLAEDWERLGKAMSELGEAQLFIDDSAGVTVMEIRGKCRRLKAQLGDLGLVVIDYMQLLEGRSNETRINQISEISRGIKLLARELDVPVIALSQLSRAVESRQDKRPMLSDLRESGCLPAETKIFRPDLGKYVPIIDLVGQTNFSVLALDENKKLVEAKASKAFYSGKKKIYELTTCSGHKIKASANHPFLTIDGWKQLGDLELGGHIATARKLTSRVDIKGSESQETSSEELNLLAHMIGDGCYAPRQPYHYTSKDQQCLRVVSDLAKNLYSIDTRVVEDRNSHECYALYLPSPYRLTHGVHHPFTNLLTKLGLHKCRGYQKELPAYLMSCDLATLASFLRHLYSTDGTVCFSGSETTGKYAVAYSSQSESMIRQLKTLLLRFGISSRIGVNKPAGYRSQYQLVISDVENIKLFAEQIGFFGKKVFDFLDIKDRLNQVKSNSGADVIPKEIWATVRMRLEQKGISHRKFQEQLRTQYCGSTLFKANISRNRFAKIAAILCDSELNNLAKSDIYWDKIKSIELVDEVDVYDITVPGFHNFVAENIILHNSIEQDADIVMFIYRDDYYNPDSEKAGIAEVIIGKQRNGPVGSVELLFQSNITKFKNPA